MQFIKHHWFGLISSIFIFLSFLFFILVLLSPRQDKEKRGFIPCTEKMAQEMMSCPKEAQYRCMFRYIVKNSWCDIKVIGAGIKLWAKREQKTPWSNYIFVPQPVVEGDAEEEKALQEYYENNPNLQLEMLKMKQLNKNLEKQIEEEIKNGQE